MSKGKLYLIPATLGDGNPLNVMPFSVKETIENLDVFIVENKKSARRFIKKITPEKQQNTLQLKPLGKHTNTLETQSYLDVCDTGVSVGLLSEAGVPAIADPGASMVALAHKKNIQVVPLVGPSSILLAMMASGMNGQNFAFNGYLPIDKMAKKKTIKLLEKKSQELNQSQIFIETPYRNDGLLKDLKTILAPNTTLCVACDITLPSEVIKTLTIQEWKRSPINLHKRPAIFIIHKNMLNNI